MPETAAPGHPPRTRTLVVACGALAREIMALVRRHGFDEAIEVQCLPAIWHNFPEWIPDGVRAKIRAARTCGRAGETGNDGSGGDGGTQRIFVAYGDCGTGGALDAVLEEEGAERIPGAHCYEFLSGADTFAALHDMEPGTFYLTDYLARNFGRLIVEGLGLDRHPELAPMYFGNYRRLVHLAQTRDEVTAGMARAAAERLGLEFEHRFTGYGALDPFLVRAAVERRPDRPGVRANRTTGAPESTPPAKPGAAGARVGAGAGIAAKARAGPEAGIGVRGP